MPAFKVGPDAEGAFARALAAPEAVGDLADKPTLQTPSGLLRDVVDVVHVVGERRVPIAGDRDGGQRPPRAIDRDPQHTPPPVEHGALEPRAEGGRVQVEPPVLVEIGADLEHVIQWVERLDLLREYGELRTDQPHYEVNFNFLIRF